MSRRLAPRWAFSAQAIDAINEPHLKPGVHIRIMVARALGIPVAPFVVSRLSLGTHARGFTQARDILWRDSNGNQLVPPFEVTPDNPVRAFFPPTNRGVCIWFEVKAEPALPERLRVEAQVNTARGPAVIGAVSKAPYQLGASPIESVRISGRGTVESLFWIDGRSLKEFGSQTGPWRTLGLPVVEAKRYAGLADAVNLSAERVKRGAPLRFGLHDNPEALNAASAPLASDGDERKRIDELTPPLQTFLDTLLNDTGAPAADLVSEHDLLPGENADPTGTLTVNILDSVLAAALDPGIGRWMGFLDVDETPATVDGEVVAYLVYGVWQLHRDRLEKDLGPFLAQPIEDLLGHDVLHILPTFELPFQTGAFVIDGDGLLLESIACVTRGNPPLLPGPPILESPRNPYPRPPFPEGPTAWSPRLVPPAASRELMIPASALSAAGTAALARRNETLTGLNRRLPITKRALSLMPSAVRWSVTDGAGTFFDSEAPPGDVFYRAAQTDWFGRWSDWSEIHGGPGVRPLPPAPSLLVTYDVPSFGLPVPNSPLGGTLNVRVPVPTISTLAPGSNLLAFVRVFIAGSSMTQVKLELPNPNAPPAELVQTIPGPPISRAESLNVTLTAQWFDGAGQASPISAAIQLTLHDPRPPEPAALVTPTLAYAARPDVTGRARVTLRWMASPVQAAFRVFYADDSRLVTALSRISLSGDPRATDASAILSEILAAPDLLHKAAVFKNHSAFFDRTLFEQLTTTPLPRPADGLMRFENDVSASYRALAFYRVVALSTAQVETPFSESPMLAFGVPNTSPPAVPVVSVEPVRTGAKLRARIAITVPAGLVHAVEYRLRRVSGAPPDPLTMPVVETGAMQAPGPDGRQVKVIVDDGRSTFGPGVLSDWTRYQWVAEVRGVAEPGGGPPTQWSAPSAPVSLMFVPPQPPAPAALSAEIVASDISLKWTHPDALRGGQLGDHRVELYRRSLGKPDQVVFSISADTEQSAGGRAPDRNGEFHFTEPKPPAGTTYRVIVRDPLGRASVPSNAFLVS